MRREGHLDRYAARRGALVAVSRKRITVFFIYQSFGIAYHWAMRAALRNAPWRRFGLICGSCLIAVLLLLLASEPSGSEISFDPAAWGFSRSQMENITMRRFRTVQTTRRFGPIKVVSTTVRSFERTDTTGTNGLRSLETISTNLLRLGDSLHNPANDKERWNVVGIEILRDSPNSTNRTNVTVRSLLTGGSMRIPQEQLFEMLAPPE